MMMMMMMVNLSFLNTIIFIHPISMLNKKKEIPVALFFFYIKHFCLLNQERKIWIRFFLLLS